jgi:hypothetical protein
LAERVLRHDCWNDPDWARADPPTPSPANTVAAAADARKILRIVYLPVDDIPKVTTKL